MTNIILPLIHELEHDLRYLYKMVAQNNVRTYGVIQVFRFVEGIWLHRKDRQIRFFRKRPILLHMCATCSELPSYLNTMRHTIFANEVVKEIANKIVDRKPVMP